MQEEDKDPMTSVLKRWEDAHSLLSNALADYLDSCFSLDVVLRRDCQNAFDCASLISSVLDTSHPVMTLKLAQSTSTLAQTKNRLTSSTGCLPEEVLHQIFLNVVYTPEILNLSAKEGIRAIYRNVHKLIAVCSVWKNIIISSGAFWDIIPATGNPILHQTLDLSLKRSTGRTLYLAATATPDGPPRLVKTLSENGSRLRTLNIQGAFSGPVTSVIINLLREGVPNQLSELFMRCSPPKYCQPPKVSDCVVGDTSAEQADFNIMMGSLSALRLSGIQLHWKSSNGIFSDRLVELHVHNVGLGYSDTTMVDFLLALSSAKGLRDLKIVDLQVRCRRGQILEVARPKVDFPKLQSLLLQDLCFNVLEFFLLAVTPGSHHTTLALSRGAFKIVHSAGGPTKISLDKITELLALTTVDTLILPRGSVEENAWLKGSDLRGLLESMPRLKELKLDSWHFTENFCNGICTPLNPELDFQRSILPKLEVLQLTEARIRDQERFKQIPIILSPRTMVFSGYIKKEDKTWVQLAKHDHMVDWLRKNVPDFSLVDIGYDAAATKTYLWRLW